MQLLVDKANMKVYIDIGKLWEDPRLLMEDEGKKKPITVSSGELEFLFGEFLINEYILSEEELEKVEKILGEIANPNSFEKIWAGRAKRFVLNDKYMAKLNSLDEYSTVTT